MLLSYLNISKSYVKQIYFAEENFCEIPRNQLIKGLFPDIISADNVSDVAVVVASGGKIIMNDNDNKDKEEGLLENERIEEAITALQKESTQEQLAHTLTVIRRRMREGGQMIVAVEPVPGGAQMNLRTVRTEDGHSWWYAFTSFEEELKGAETVKSTFLADIGKLFETALGVPEIEGIIVNPWNRTIMLDKNLIRIIMPEKIQ